MTQRSVCFAPTSLFVSHFPEDAEKQAQEFLKETWQEQRNLKRFIAASIPTTPATTPTDEPCDEAPVHKVLPSSTSKQYSEKEMKSAFYVGAAFGAVTVVLFLWMHGKC